MPIERLRRRVTRKEKESNSKVYSKFGKADFSSRADLDGAAV